MKLRIRRRSSSEEEDYHKNGSSFSSLENWETSQFSSFNSISHFPVPFIPFTFYMPVILSLTNSINCLYFMYRTCILNFVASGGGKHILSISSLSSPKLIIIITIIIFVIIECLELEEEKFLESILRTDEKNNGKDGDNLEKRKEEERK